jgi:hypothetical protein
MFNQMTSTIHITRVGSTGGGRAYAVTGDGRQHAISAELLTALVRSARGAGADVDFHHYGPHDVWRFNGEEGIAFLPAPIAVLAYLDDARVWIVWSWQEYRRRARGLLFP